MIETFGIITNCTSRKRAVGEVARLKPVELRGGPANIATRWLATTTRALPVMPAGDLYVGRAMSESKAVASRLAGSLHVVSAGLGLAARDVYVPNYDLTVVQGSGSIAPALAQAGYGLADWWQELNALKGTPLPLSRHINKAARTKFLVALPSAYICMLEHDLEGLEASALERICIFTSRSGAGMLPTRLQRCVMRYDERLEGHQRYAGTRSDFPQRAMRHFVEELDGQLLGVESGNDAVERAMAQLKQPVIPQRARKTDKEIIELIRSQWVAHAGSSSRLHRYLRDTALVACEQSRFGGLWRQVKAEVQ
jgi:hypothetical protein